MFLQFKYGSQFRQSWRMFATALLLVCYMTSGVLHDFLDLDVTNVTSIVAMEMGKTPASHSGQPDNGPIAEHHCHGCFPASLPALVATAAVKMPLTIVHDVHDLVLHGLSASLDPPPPKSLA